MYLPNLKSVALPNREIIAIEVWGGVQTPILGKGGHRESGMVPFERALVSSYRPHSNFPSIFMRVRDIATLCSSTPRFPTPPLVYPKFSHVPLGIGGWRLATKSEYVGLIVRVSNFQEFQPM